MTADDIQDLILSFEWFDESDTCVVISRAKRPTPDIEAEITGTQLTWLDDVKNVSDLDQLDRHSLAVVFSQFEHMEKDDAVHLLAILRDRYARQVLVCDDRRVFTSAELLALGYAKDKRPRISGRFYLHDPEAFFERREWNNPRDWANPENFERFRW